VPRAKRSTGVILAWVGCGVVALVAFLGIIAAILIPNFLDALQKAKQKRTVADMRILGTAVFSYATDEGRFPNPEELSSVLVPKYIQAVPTQDGWEHPLQYVCSQEKSDSTGCDTFLLASAGRDGVYEHDDLTDYQPGVFEPTDYDADIVYRDGEFLRRPGQPGSTP
jgi:general secretion pathway protein G